MQKVSWLITPDNIVVNYEGQTHTLSREDAYSVNLIEALKTKNWEVLPNLISQAKRIETFSEGKFQVRDGEIMVEGVKAPEILGRKIQEFVREGLPYEPLVKFAKNLQLNPSYRAICELYGFLEKNNHPITDNGCFIAYKKVRPNFMDIHSGTYDNSPGKTPSMPRSGVDEDAHRTCSNGLHVANWDYAANHFGSSSDIMLEVEVDPADVVAIPVDYNQSKMRVCKYRVLGVVDKELSTPLRRVEPACGPVPVPVEEVEELEECEDCYTESDTVEFSSTYGMSLCESCLSDHEASEDEEDWEEEEEEEDEEDYDVSSL